MKKLKHLIIVLCLFLVCALLWKAVGIVSRLKVLSGQAATAGTEAALTGAAETDGTKTGEAADSRAEAQTDVTKPDGVQAGETADGLADVPTGERQPEQTAEALQTAEMVQTGMVQTGNEQRSETWQQETQAALHPILMGDSRTVCLYCSQAYDEAEYPKHLFYAMSEDFSAQAGISTFVAKGGEGDAWFEKYGLAKGITFLDENAVMVVWFGVNDLDKVQRYINYINGVALTYGAPVYYMTIGPCDGNWESKNADILNFNAALTAQLDPAVHVIDMYSFISNGLLTGEFATIDGLHYDYKTSMAVYQHMLEEIEAAQALEGGV